MSTMAAVAAQRSTCIAANLISPARRNILAPASKIIRE
jgi:hypothetical protein